VESLSAYARQFLEQMDKPDVDAIEGLSPAISIEQRTASSNPRSTVGTVTEIYDYLRLLFARIASPAAPSAAWRLLRRLRPRSSIRSWPCRKDQNPDPGPLVDSKKGEHAQLLQKLRKDGFTRAKIDGETVLLEENILLEKSKKHTISVIVDRVVLNKEIRRRLTDSMNSPSALRTVKPSLNSLAKRRSFSARKRPAGSAASAFPN